MQYRKLGNSGLKVSEISLGSWLTYGGYVAEDNAVRSIEQAYELGVNFFDTANMYERGEAEKVMGKALSSYPRESYVLATKVFNKMGEGPNDRGLSRKHIMEQCDASLKRLGADYIDIYYCHRYDPETPLEETLRALDDLVSQGKVLYIGVSEWTPAQIVEAYAIADKLLLDKIIVNQPVYNMFNRYIEKEIIPVGKAKGFGQVVFSPLAQGLLTGKYRLGQPVPQDSRAASKNWDEKRLNEKSLQKIERLSVIADELGVKLSQLAISWILRQDNVASALVGASRPEQVVENCGAVGLKLSDDVLSTIEEILQG
ncbi:aldo/keto reductase family protein [Paenibacillus allorhizosphaerae]|uniref:L-glyceraldehyde 3-phosphate reductase n=1 Tax=Paenibacillus allorhizosphaerae TaxID=2849866 RepID=A0ABM8VK12_9BACL|nr:aldo/keto reductase family protein [Paenibacillus allorhizosphaerae]CAG7646303.1 L-glyceraldehyde 3-phosphate reductase [Paenibacillus allorhizosphaerae]